MVFAFFKKRKGPPTIQDPVFGSLRYVDGRWSGDARFKPTNGVVYVMLEGDNRGPTEAQRRFFRQIEARFSDLASALERALRKLVNDVQHEPGRDLQYIPQVGLADCSLDGIGINTVGSGPVTWDVNFGWSGDREWLFTVFLEDWQVLDVGADYFAGIERQ